MSAYTTGTSNVYHPAHDTLFTYDVMTTVMDAEEYMNS
jgi:hypothetical protein